MVKTAELIKKDTKPCPSCGERIQKIQGCDQMWCIKCHQAFSWKTGAIDSGPIHNPHYYELQRRGGNLARAPGDVLCGGVPRWYIIFGMVMNHYVFDDTSLFGIHPYQKERIKISAPTPLSPPVSAHMFDVLSTINRNILHIQHVMIAPLRQTVLNEDNKKERAKYIMNEITKEELADTIYLKDRSRKKIRDLLYIYELLLAVGTELFVGIQNKLQNVCDNEKNLFQDQEILIK